MFVLRSFLKLENQPKGHEIHDSGDDFLDPQPILINGVRQPNFFKMNI
jgi:hypothetical protein